MGVDYRAATGYGFVVPDDGLEELAEEIGYEEPEYGFDMWSFGGWLVKDHPQLTAETVGDVMNGHEIYLAISVDRLWESVNLYEGGGVRKFVVDDIALSETTGLYDVHYKLFGRYPRGQELYWFSAMTVS